MESEIINILDIKESQNNKIKESILYSLEFKVVPGCGNCFLN
jgi:hypothetical protein